MKANVNDLILWCDSLIRVVEVNEETKNYTLENGWVVSDYDIYKDEVVNKGTNHEPE